MSIYDSVDEITHVDFDAQEPPLADIPRAPADWHPIILLLLGLIALAGSFRGCG